MLDIFAKKLAFYLSDDSDEQEVCAYGIEILISNGLLFVSIIVISVLLQQFLISMYFTIIFAVLRIMLPGFHCEKYSHCYLISIAIYLLFIGSYWLLQSYEKQFKLVALILLAVTVVLFIIYCLKNPCTNNGKISFFLCFLWSVSFTIVGQSSAGYPILYCMMATVVLLFMKKTNRRIIK